MDIEAHAEFIRRWFEEGFIMFPNDPLVFEWLSQQSPDAWHSFVSTWNYDYDGAVLKWIMAHPKCDKGTAVLLFRRDGSDWLSKKHRSPQRFHEERYDDYWCAVSIAEHRLLKDNFISADLITHGEYEPSYFRISGRSGPYYEVPSDVIDYKGTREAYSEVIYEDTCFMMSRKAFCKSIGVDLQ